MSWSVVSSARSSACEPFWENQSKCGTIDTLASFFEVTLSRKALRGVSVKTYQSTCWLRYDDTHQHSMLSLSQCECHTCPLWFRLHSLAISTRCYFTSLHLGFICPSDYPSLCCASRNRDHNGAGPHEEHMARASWVRFRGKRSSLTYFIRSPACTIPRPQGYLVFNWCYCN
jgi:hypothetical protein